MKCMSCQSEIDPKWAHAINTNVCPFCGSSVMEEHLKNLFATLRETMDNLKEYPEQLDDWMLSNYEFIRTTSEKIKQYMPKGFTQQIKEFAEPKIVKMKDENGEEIEISTTKALSDERTNEFFKRAEVKGGNPAAKTEKLRAIKQQIEKAGVTSGSNFDMNDAHPDDINEYQEALMAEDESLINLSGNNLANHNDESWDDIPLELRAISQNAGNKNANVNAKDLAALEKLVSRSQGHGGGLSFKSR